MPKKISIKDQWCILDLNHPDRKIVYGPFDDYNDCDNYLASINSILSADEYDEYVSNCYILLMSK